MSRLLSHEAKESGAMKAHFGAAAFERLDPHAADGRVLHFLQRPGHESADLRIGPRHGQPVGEPAGRLHQAGGRQVNLVEHDPRGKAHETGAAVRLIDDGAGNAKPRVELIKNAFPLSKPYLY